MTNLQMMQELRPIMENLTNAIEIVTARQNATDHLIQRLQHENAQLHSHNLETDMKLADLGTKLEDHSGDHDVRG